MMIKTNALPSVIQWIYSVADEQEYVNKSSSQSTIGILQITVKTQEGTKKKKAFKCDTWRTEDSRWGLIYSKDNT